MSEKETLLIVDDDELIQDALSTFFESHFHIINATSLREVKSVLAQSAQQPQYALVDLGLPPLPHQPTEGFSVLSVLQAHAPECAVVVVSGQDAKQHAQRARALGATDYAEKPCSPKQLLDKLQTARRIKAIEMATRGLIGDSQPLVMLRQQIGLVAPVAFPVLIEGESGVGKELVARALHDHARRGKPFLTVNCAAIPEHLVEPMLFGYAKGSFTGATRDNPGYLGDAGDGTLLLDEIADFPTTVQPKLLRVLETGEYQRVGETRPQQCSARIIAASNRSRGGRQSGYIRDDLYYRLSVLTIHVPPLRQLGNDRFLLLEHFSHILAKDLATAPFTLAESALVIWAEYQFPGNVRELKNIIARLQIKYGGETVTSEALQYELCSDIENSFQRDLSNESPSSLLQLNSQSEDTMRKNIRLAAQTAQQTFTASGNDIERASHRLGINRDLLKSLLDLSKSSD